MVAVNKVNSNIKLGVNGTMNKPLRPKTLDSQIDAAAKGMEKIFVKFLRWHIIFFFCN